MVAGKSLRHIRQSLCYGAYGGFNADSGPDTGIRLAGQVVEVAAGGACGMFRFFKLEQRRAQR